MPDLDAAREIVPDADSRATLRQLPRTTYDLVIIGGGSAGISAAELAAALGARVALLDRERLGGECLYTGCVPSKALLHVAHVAAQIRTASALGLDAQLASVELAGVSDYVQRAIQTIYDRSENPEHFHRLGVEVALGEVRFLSADRVAVNGQPVRAKHFLLATGSRAVVPPIPGLAEVGYRTNETIFGLRTLPKRLGVIGGGPIGCELGQAFAQLGSRVTILQRPDRLLPRDEPEASALLRERLEAEGVTVVTRAEVTAVTRRDGDGVLAFQTGDEGGEVMVDAILVAVGRAPNVESLDLEAAGVHYDARQGITVDRYLRTSNSRIYAAGDVTGGYRFTHAAALQARTAVRNALFPGGTALDERAMPWTTFTEPEVAHVGLSEAQARQRYGDGVLRIFVQSMREVDRAVTDGVTEGFVKLVATAHGKLLGAQIVAPHAGEYVNELALALQTRRGLAELAATTHVYPTLALAIQQAAGQYTSAKLMRSRLVPLLRRLVR
jgi:pyruvate/2-oxoglutarate dehydrogenase complex dihydrolipoamide dehydrogenase (E3) component